ncbi:XRE family transcriptional regulator [Sphaerisporangium album]|uniref:XRE family transcriptional regulator n=1 Tax=Sphaerisporangium album TaxID=509200 RepID=A0A367FF13_9ACTN|nr:helix-turn-helix transcriptional regulator [Sphaerisporangium album]RCG28277.1 XRE family transcriptional regulator [Sphaerisporangium album]
MAGNAGTSRAFLGRELRRAREAKGITRASLAKVCYVSESLVKLWETGRRVPVPDHLAQMDQLFEMNGILVRLREELVKTAVPLEWFGRWPEVENRAASLWWFEPTVIPGLLQTEDYMRAVLHAGNHQADVEEMVSARLERQKVLEKEDDPPMLVALISESVLRHNAGGAKTMVDQLTSLADMAERDNSVIVQIIPNRAFACAGFIAHFVIAGFDDGTDVAYVDNQLSGEVVEHAEDLVRLKRMFDAFRAEALPKQESISLIMEEVERWRI